MNKLLKGAVAGAAGVALLLGGAGTFALWNDAATVSGGTIATGTLSISKSVSPVWTDISPAVANGTTFDPTTQSLVPGDKVQLTQSVVITATGKNLKASLTFDPTSITNTAGLLTTLVATPTAGSATVVSSGANTFTITPGASATTTVNVTFTVEFPSTTTGTTGQGATSAVDLRGLKFTLTQLRP